MAEEMNGFALRMQVEFRRGEGNHQVVNPLCSQDGDCHTREALDHPREDLSETFAALPSAASAVLAATP